MEMNQTLVNYLINHRLRWGRRDTLSLLKSDIVDDAFDTPADDVSTVESDPPAYFSWETPRRFLSIIQNDWPYSGKSFCQSCTTLTIPNPFLCFIVPPEIEHTLIWTKVPIYHSDLVEDSVKPRIDQDGLWGFTGNDDPPPSPSNLQSCLPSLSEWGITEDKMIKSEPPTPAQAVLIEKAGKEVHRYVKNRWLESEWETAWFVNPPVSYHLIFFRRSFQLLSTTSRDYKVYPDWRIFTFSLAARCRPPKQILMDYYRTTAN